MRRMIPGLILAALTAAGLTSTALAEPRAAAYPAQATEAVAAGCNYTYEELLACLTEAGCTQSQALSYAGEPVEAPEGAVVRYSLLRLTDFDGTDPQPVECRVLAALEYAPGCAEPRSILAIRSPMAVAADGSAFEGQAFAALYSGRNFYCDLSGNSLAGKSYILWAGTDWITPDGQDTGYAPGTESRPDDRILAGESGTLTSARSVSCYQSGELFFPTLEK